MEKDFVLNSRNFFYKKGYFKTKISDIAKKSGSSVGSFYRFFDSKEDILIAVIKQELEVYRRDIRLLNTIDFNLNWKVAQLCRITLSLLKENPHLFILIYDIEEKKEKISSKVYKWIDMLWKESKGVFVKGVREANSNNPIDTSLVERLFENQMKIYLKYLLKDRAGKLNPDIVISMNLEEESKKLTSMIISNCESLNIIRACDKFDPLTKAYTPLYTNKEVKNYLLDGSPFFVAFMVFRWPENLEKRTSPFFRDSILRAFVYIVREKFRDKDIIGRLCNNKFIFVIPFTKKGGPADFSRRIKEVIDELVKKYSLFEAEYFQYSVANILKPSDFDSKIKKLPQNTGGVLD